MPILLRSPDRPKVRIVTAFEWPSGLNFKDFAAIFAAYANLIFVKVFGFERAAFHWE